MPHHPRIAAIALGSNLGDRESHLHYAVGRLRPLLRDIRLSSFIDTAPVGVSPQPVFLNAAATGVFDGPPRDLLDALLSIESECGRTRPHVGAPRTLDLDLILFGDLVLREEGLTVPHPRFRDRRFVLEPLCEIAPGLVDPVTGMTVGELLARLEY